MKERPILFSGEMVRAILSGEKTQTRRVVKIKSVVKTDMLIFNIDGLGPVNCPYGKIGDRLWVRETWAMIDNYGLDIQEGESVNYIEYRADTGNKYPGEWPEDEARGNDEAPKWKPSIHMFRKYSRIDLEITNIRVERLQSITVEDIRAEGMKYYVDINGEYETPDPWDIFSELWDSINKKKHPWKSNPFVWVVEFKRLTKKGG